MGREGENSGKPQLPVSPQSGNRFFCILKTSTSELTNTYRTKLKQLDLAVAVFINVLKI